MGLFLFGDFSDIIASHYSYDIAVYKLILHI